MNSLNVIVIALKYTHCVYFRKADVHTMLTDGGTLNVYAFAVNKKEIGKQLKSIRQSEPKITLEKLAEETKSLTKSGISNYEQGLRMLKPREAGILAKTFTRLGKPVNASQLLGIEAYPSGVQEPPPVYGTVDKKRFEECLAILYEMLPPAEFPITAKEQAVIVERFYSLMDSEGKIATAEIVRLVRPIKEKYEKERDRHGGRIKTRP